MNIWYQAHLVLVQATLVSALLAFSLQVPLRFGVFSFAGAGSYVIGQYVAAIAITKHGLSAAPAILAGVVASVVVGLVLALLLQRLDGLYLGMATISFDLILTVVVTNGGTLTGGAEGLFGVLTGLNTAYVALIVLLAVAAIALTERGRTGRRIEAVRDDPELAVAMGISVRRVQRFAFLFSGALGGLAGAINVQLTTTVTPAGLGFPLVIVALTMVVVGGSRSWVGAALGAVIFTWLPQALDLVGEWKNVIYGVVVTLVVVLLPGGLVDALNRLNPSRGDLRRVRLASAGGPDVLHSESEDQ